MLYLLLILSIFSQYPTLIHKCGDYIKRGEFKKAEKILQRLDEGVNFLRGEISYFTGDFDTAFVFYKKVKPDSPFANDAIKRIIFINEIEKEYLENYKDAEMLGNKGQFEKAISILRKIEGEFSFFLIAELLEKKEDLSQAIGGYKDILKQYPESSLVPLAYMRIGTIYTKMGKRKKALEIYEEFILRFPKHALTPIIRAKIEEM